MNKIFLLVMVVALLSCGRTNSNNGGEARLFDNNVELKTFPVAAGWGYSIDVNSKKFIRQETIPVLQGSSPFATKEQAEKVGAWVASHIRHNEEFSLTLPVLQNLMASTDNVKN